MVSDGAAGGQSTARLRLADILSRSDNPADRVEALDLRVLDAEGLNPEAAALLVLSACWTALDGSAGLESLASAMRAEGVRTVPDRSTALFMQRYYLHLSNGAGRAEALRLTQLDFLASVGPALPEMVN